MAPCFTTSSCFFSPPIQIPVHHTQGSDCRVPQGHSEGMLRRLLYQPSYTSGCLCIIPALIVSSINSGMMDGGLEGSDTIS